MANMMDYIAWRGDIPMGFSPLNDLDSLILASLSYLDFPQEPMLIRDLALSLPPADDLQLSFVHDIRAMLSAAGMTERFAGVQAVWAAGVTDVDREMQFAATTFALPEGGHYVAFRGTDNSIVGWREDFNMAFESPVPAQAAAVKYLTKIAELTSGPLIVGGHSKGGNLAIYAAAHADPMVQSRIQRIYSFDGPGLDDATMASDGYANIARRIRSFVPQQSVIGLLLAYHPEYTVVKSNAVSILQHDTFSWQALGTGLISATELDVSSQLVDQTVHAWLSRISPEERRVFVETVFDILESAGVATVKELLRDVPDRLPALLRALSRVDFETARMILSLMGQFVSIGASNMIELVRQRMIAQEDRNELQGDADHVNRIETGN